MRLRKLGLALLIRRMLINLIIKLNSLQTSFCKEREFKNYLQGVGDPGTQLMFMFPSGTNGLNEELGRHMGKNDDRQWNGRVL